MERDSKLPIHFAKGILGKKAPGRTSSPGVGSYSYNSSRLGLEVVSRNGKKNPSPRLSVEDMLA